VLQLRVFGDASEMGQVAERLGMVRGSSHVVRSGDGASGKALVTADLGDDAADAALDAVSRLGVSSDDVVLLRVESVGPGASARPFASVVWTDMLSEAGKNARPLARYLIFALVAGIIACFGVIYQNSILIVGAMAVSPDMLPITATCTGLVLRRWMLATSAFATLVIGLAAGGMIAALMTFVLNHLDLLPAGFNIDAGVVRGLATVNVSTVFVAGVAGIAGILALETRASAGVGVAISVTTIPASAYFGVAAGIGELSKAFGALLVLGINVFMLILGGSSTLLLQKWRETRDRGGDRRPAGT
jgi:uncharacterized hydrophobic protein (TIGR00271 family)